MNRPRTHQSKRRRGSILIGAMAVIFMLLVVVMALHHYQSLSRQAFLTAEAELRFREGSRFELAKQTGAAPANPGGHVVDADIQGSKEGVAINATYAKDLFNRKAGLPNLAAKEFAAGHNYLQIRPNTHGDAGLSVWGSRKFTAVVKNTTGYAAYAPKGSVNVTVARGWSNPDFEDKRETTIAFSGVPATLVGLNDVTATNLTYGELHTIQGTAKIVEGDGVAFKAPQFPSREYSDSYIQGILQAKTALEGNAAGGDKTHLMAGGKDSEDAIFNLIFGGDKGLQDFLSLHNANHFFLPCIPTIALTAPPYVFEIYFHVPLPPDNANFDTPAVKGAQDALKDLSQQLKQASEEAKPLLEALHKAQQEYADHPDAAHLAAVNTAQSNYDVAKAKIENLNAQIKDKSDVISQQSGMGQGAQKMPTTRNEDKDRCSDEGITGWNYSVAGKLVGGILSSIGSLMTGDVDAAKHKFANAAGNTDVSFVLFGGKDRQYAFDVDTSHLTMGGTMTVPRGRALKLSSPGTVKILGDLWIQRGATLVVDTPTLSVEPPAASLGDPNDFRSPSGRIFLEEGASLVCSGEVRATGTPQWGSLMVGGVPDQIHPITTAIFAKKVVLPNGMMAGCTLDDLVLGLSDGNPAFQSINDKILSPLLNEVAPSVAKAVGPFFARQPYFAKYCTTFQFGLAPGPPVGEPIIPYLTPIPLPHENMMNPIAKALGITFQVFTNLNLGENFYTHSDWWIFGEGVVPMVPQVNPKEALTAIANFPATALDALNPGTILQDFATNFLKTKVIPYVVGEVIAKIIEKVATAAIPYVGSTLGDLISELTPALTNLLKNAVGGGGGPADGILSNLSDSLVSSAKGTLTTLQTKLTNNVLDSFLRQYNGCLVYASETIEINGKAASGMFVAENDVTINADQCIGTLLSHSGNIRCRSLLYYPYFNRASLCLPKATIDPTDFDYDKAAVTKLPADVPPPAVPGTVTAMGWSK